MAFMKSVPAWLEKIRRLLNHHTIQLADDDFQIWALMRDKENGQVRVWRFERVAESERDQADPR